MAWTFDSTAFTLDSTSRTWDGYAPPLGFTTSTPASRTCTNEATDRSNSISAKSRTCVNQATDRTFTI